MAWLMQSGFIWLLTWQLGPDCRKTLADYLKDLRSVDGGDRQLTSWLKEEGFQTSLRTINQVGAPLLCRKIAVDLDRTDCEATQMMPSSAPAKKRGVFLDSASLGGQSWLRVIWSFPAASSHVCDQG